VSEASIQRIFISYRREDTRHMAGRLFDRLVDRLGEDNVFIDVNSLEPGADFAEAIEQAIDGCDVLLVLIGEMWLRATDEDGRRRLEDRDDLVALEVCAALDRGVRVIPVLVDGAVAPRRDDLPEHLALLARRHATRLDHETFRSDVAQLLAALCRVRRSKPAGTGTSSVQNSSDSLEHDRSQSTRSSRPEPAEQVQPQAAEQVRPQVASAGPHATDQWNAGHIRRQPWAAGSRRKNRERIEAELIAELRWKFRTALAGTSLERIVYSPSGPTRAVPMIGHVDLGPPVRLTVRLRPGQTRADFVAAAPSIASGMGVTDVETTQLDPPQWVRIVLGPASDADPATP